jgi:hypothetical protein
MVPRIGGDAIRLDGYYAAQSNSRTDCFPGKTPGEPPGVRPCHPLRLMSWRVPIVEAGCA